MQWKLQISFWRGLTRPRRFTFAFVTSVSDTCMLSELCFQDSCVVFLWVKSLGRPLLFEPYIRPRMENLLAKESSTDTIVRRYGSLCGHVKKSATAKNHKNWRTSNLFPNMKNRYPKTYIPKESEWKTAFMSTAEFCEFLVMCGKHSFITSTLWTDERRKLCVSLNRYSRPTEDGNI